MPQPWVEEVAHGAEGDLSRGSSFGYRELCHGLTTSGG